MADITSNNPNLIERAGDYNLEVVNIISYRFSQEDGVPYQMDMKPSTVSVEVYEDIYHSCVSGILTVFDSQDVRTVLPITGLEKLELKFSTPGMPGYNAVREEGHPFQIFKIESAQPTTSNPRSQYYRIHFCSVEKYYNNMNRVSQAYAGPIEDSVHKIFRDKDYLNSKKFINIEETRTNSKFVIPNLRPLDAIQFLGNQAISKKYNNAGYMLYENSLGFHFRSIESMLAMNGEYARPASFDYKYTIVRKPDGGLDVENDMMSAINYEFIRPANTLHNMREGMYANRLVLHDMFHKTIKTHDYNYFVDFNQHFHTENDKQNKAALKGVTPFAKFEDTGKDLGSTPLSKLMTMCDNQKVHNDYEFPLLKDTIQNRLSQRVSLNNVMLNLRVYGNSLLHTGDIINFYMPLMRPNTEQANPYWGGRYLITAIRHEISVIDKRYEMYMSCMKDAVKTELPIEIANPTVVETPQYTAYNDIYSADERMLNDTTILDRSES